MDAIVELAKMFQDRNNPTVQGIGIGKVISAPPKPMILFNGFQLDSSWLIISEYLLTEITTNPASVGDHGSHDHTIDRTLKVGDFVIVVPSPENAKYFIIGKVG